MMTKDKLRQLSGDERLGQMRESEYLGAEDIDDGTEPILTIACGMAPSRSSAARKIRMCSPSRKNAYLAFFRCGR